MNSAADQAVKKMREAVRGSVLSDQTTLQKFSHDQSIYEIDPLAVVFSDDIEDMQRLVEHAGAEGIAITPRGGGSGTAGGALGNGIVLALPENGYWGRIDSFSAVGHSARVSVGAGVYHNDLQTFLKERGFFLPADVTSAAISRIGGNIATKASGPHALRYGSIDRFLESVEFITAEGAFVNTADEGTIPARFKTALADLERRIRQDGEAMRRLESRKGLKTSSGYNLTGFLEAAPTGAQIAALMTGSVGTLGIVTGAALRAEPYSGERAAALLYFEDLAGAGRAVLSLRETEAVAIELISRETIRTIGERTPLPDQLSVDAHALFVETTGPDRQQQVGNILARLERDGQPMSAPPSVALSDSEVEKIWSLRKQILWLIQHPGPGRRALAVVNDVAVPPARLAAFITDIEKVLAAHALTALIYGHAGNGNLHLRPLLDVTLPDLDGRIRRLADDVYETVFRHNGTITAEHGMGRLRAPFLKREWGERLYGYLREIKTVFDPQGILNPGVMFGNESITDHLRPDLLLP